MFETVIERTKVKITGKGVADPRDRMFDISVSATVEIDAITARRRATVWLVSEVGNLIGGGVPTLDIGTRTVWRVPAVLTSPRHGVRGQVGRVDVDAVTGEVYSSDSLREEILNHARTIAHSNSPLPTDR
jgi:hypothetical protein